MTTPMMQQYRDAKAKHPDMLLLFRMGDFYELFETDAETAHKVLGLTLTSRDKEMPMAGFPHHQLEQYLQKLLRLGHRVAVCDQVEDAAAAKGLVKRDVTRVVTTDDKVVQGIKAREGNGVLVLRTAEDRPASRKWPAAIDKMCGRWQSSTSRSSRSAMNPRRARTPSQAGVRVR